MLQIRYFLEEIGCNILSLDLSEKFEYTLNEEIVKEAISKGTIFEICYGKILDTCKRRNLIKNSINLVKVCGGKNLIISSEVNEHIKHRTPLEIKTLSSLFGIKEKDMQTIFIDNCKTVIKKSIPH